MSGLYTATLFAVSTFPYLEGLSPEQRAAVLEPASRALVLAGAGSGKTRVLVARAAHLLLAAGIASSRLIAFSFTRKACAEIEGRLAALLAALPGGLSPPRAFTFNAFAWRLLVRFHRQAGFVRPPRIVAEGGELEPLEAFARYLGEVRPPCPSGSARSLFLRMRPGPREVADPGLASLEAGFGAWKRAQGLVELSEQIPLAVELLEGPIGDRVRAELDVVLVDEYQDIDPGQQRLFELLLRPETGFMVFGDDDQAIYRWRGSDPASIRACHRRPDVVTHLLTTNYRCPAPILAVAATVVSRAPGRVAKPAHAARTSGCRPCCLADSDQAKRLAEVVRQLLARGRQPETLAILVREHADAREVARALERAGIPVVERLDQAGVRLLTFHASKGLEFPVVLIPFLDRGRFPNHRRLAREREALRRRLREAKRARRVLWGITLRRAWLEGSDASRAGAIRRLWALMGAFVLRVIGRVRGEGWRRARAERLAKITARMTEQAAWLPVLEAARRTLPAEQREALAEERRLCYVAMTRAQEELWLFCAERGRCSEFLREAAGLILWGRRPGGGEREKEARRPGGGTGRRKPGGQEGEGKNRRKPRRGMINLPGIEIWEVLVEEESLTGRIIGAAITVHRELGPGFLESVYENALVLELTARGIQFDRQHEVPILFHGVEVGHHRLDLLVEERIVVELKTVKDIADIHFVIARSYLCAAGRDHGLILNFAKPTLEAKRVRRWAREPT